MIFFIFSRKAVERVNSPLVFCHNDLQCGNILLREGSDALASIDDSIVVIDYEFCSYNYRAFDIANHLCEWMFDYNHKEWPFFHCEKDKFPSKEKQVSQTRFFNVGPATNILFFKAIMKDFFWGLFRTC